MIEIQMSLWIGSGANFQKLIPYRGLYIRSGRSTAVPTRGGRAKGAE